jgi:tryptophan halogenase
MRIPYVNKEKEMEHTTNATTLSSGWVWNTPLWDRIGTGYVYSSKFLSKEEAEKEFKEYLINSRDVPHSREEIESIGVLHVDINTGIHERAWVKNVCAIGLSNGFIEPLESTGLMLTHNTIFALVQALQSRDTRVNGWDKTIFNKKVRTHMQKFSGFIAAHFAFCERDDTAYWKYVTDTIDYGALESKEWYALQLVSDNLTIDRNWDTFDNISGVPFIMAGMGFNPLTEDIIRKSYGIGAGKLKGTVPWDNSIELTTYVNDYYDGIEEYIHSLDSHYKFLNSTIYKEIQ